MKEFFVTWRDSNPINGQLVGGENVILFANNPRHAIVSGAVISNLYAGVFSYPQISVTITSRHSRVRSFGPQSAFVSCELIVSDANAKANLFCFAALQTASLFTLKLIVFYF